MILKIKSDKESSQILIYSPPLLEILWRNRSFRHFECQHWSYTKEASIILNMAIFTLQILFGTTDSLICYTFSITLWGMIRE